MRTRGPGPSPFGTGVVTARAETQADHVVDRTSISDDGREFLSAVDEMSEQLKQDDPRREEHVLEVRQKLLRGELDQPVIFGAVAEAMLEVEF